ncbi:MAG: hypothetical protein Q8R92_16315, partial [Deltaproteobacteria bacterium]|nr:hypothetical protein [Deltaproteobacteria bacterium]
AEEADVANISMIFSAGTVTPEGVKEHSVESFMRKRNILRRHCDEIGRDFAELKIASQLFTMVSKDENLVKSVSEMSAAQVGIDPEIARALPNVAIGTPNQVIDVLGERIEKLGIDVFICNFLSPEIMQAFATDVMPHLNPEKP